MRPKVVITKKIPGEVEKYIGKFCDYCILDGETLVTDEAFLKELSDADGLLTTGIKINETLLDQAPNLKIVSDISVGYDNFDLAVMEKRKIMGTHTPYVLDETVADLALGLMLSVARRLPELDRFVRDGKWGEVEEEQLFGIDVHHATLGIIGMGRIGESIARRAKCGFNMNVLYYNRNRKIETEQELGVQFTPFNDLLRESDFILLMTPLTKETYHLIGEKEFDLMKKSAIFINTSRGKTVDEQALIHALDNGSIYGAGLDVFHEEPLPGDHPLFERKNAVLAPHIGSATAKVRFDMAMKAAENVVAGVMGERPTDLVKELKGIAAFPSC